MDEDTGASALLSACEKNSSEVVKLLIEQDDIDPNIGSTERGTSPLNLASRMGYEEIVQLLLAHENTDVNIGNYDGATPLILASIYGHTRIVSQLLTTLTINVNQGRRDGWNALMLASKHGYSEIVALLLQRNDLNVNKEPRNGGCALYEASKFGNIDAVKSLLFHPDIEINQIHNDVARRTEFSSLQIALERGHLNVASILLHCPTTDITRRDRKNDTIEDRARKINATEIIELLRLVESNGALEHSCCSQQVNEKLVHATHIGDEERVNIFSRCYEFDINTGHNGMTPLHVASIKGHNDLVRFFLENEMIDVNKRDGKGDKVSALFYACKNRHIKIVKQLVEFHGIELNIQHAKNGATALHVATEHGDVDILRLLIQHPISINHINPNIGDDEGRTALMLASSTGQLGLMEILLEHPKIDVNKLTSYDRTTALYVACLNKQTNAVTYLLAQPQTNVNKGLTTPLGASVGQRYNNIVKNMLRCPKTDVHNSRWHGISVTDYAKRHGFMNILYLLENQDLLLEGTKMCCLDVDKDILRSAYIGHVIMLEELLKCPDSNINDQGSDRNALYIASELGHTDYVKKIISYDINKTSHQIDINKRNTHFGKTALYVAAEKKKLEVIKVLVKHSDIRVNKGRSRDGGTAFSIASERGFFKIMEELINHHEIDVNAGWSTRDWTFQTRNDVIEIFEITDAPTFTPTRYGGNVNVTTHIISEITLETTTASLDATTFENVNATHETYSANKATGTSETEPTTTDSTGGHKLLQVGKRKVPISSSNLHIYSSQAFSHCQSLL